MGGEKWNVGKIKQFIERLLFGWVEMWIHLVNGSHC